MISVLARWRRGGLGAVLRDTDELDATRAPMPYFLQIGALAMGLAGRKLRSGKRAEASDAICSIRGTGKLNKSEQRTY
jgi:hypothetical protein